jgi:hypothetical protein
MDPCWIDPLNSHAVVTFAPVIVLPFLCIFAVIGVTLVFQAVLSNKVMVKVAMTLRRIYCYTIIPVFDSPIDCPRSPLGHSTYRYAR